MKLYTRITYRNQNIKSLRNIFIIILFIIIYMLKLELSFLDGLELVRLSWCTESSTYLTSGLAFIMVNHLDTELGAFPCSTSYSQASLSHTL